MMLLTNTIENNHVHRASAIIVDHIRAADFREERWEAWLLTQPPLKLECALEKVYEVGSGMTADGKPVGFVNGEALTTTPLQYLISLGENRKDFLLESAFPFGLLPLFLAQGANHIPCVYDIAIRLTALMLYSLPDVRAQLALVRLFEKQNVFYLADNVIFHNSQHKTKMAERTKVPTGCFLPIAIENETNEVLGALSLRQNESADVFLASLYLADQWDVEAGTVLNRSVEWVEDRQVLKCRNEIGVVLSSQTQSKRTNKECHA